MTIHDKTIYIDQLKEWWENAEGYGSFREGDTLIFKYGDEYTIQPAYEDGQIEHGTEERILSRAPKPKPAWHDAKAVIASTDYCERQVWERDTTYENRWYGTAGDGAVTRDLRDVTPLIEAKVTDEMVERGAQAGAPAGVRYLRPHEVREVLAAALGIEEGPG